MEFIATDNAAVGAPRRLPVQERSTNRVELILDTMASLIDEVGYADITVSLLAKRSSMSGPSVYRYFDDLHSVAQALAERNLHRFVERVAELIADESLDWVDALERVVDVYAGFCRTEPGFRWLRLGDPIDRFLMSSADSNRTLLARFCCQLFFERYEVDYRPDLLRHVEVMVEVADVLTARAFESDADGDPFYLEECRRGITAYLSEYLARPHPIIDRPVDWMTAPA
jgi:AcrR family transcriptional regulator